VETRSWGTTARGLRCCGSCRKVRPGIDAVEGGVGGLGLIPLMEGYDKVVIVDAMVGIGDRAGEVRVFRSPPPSRRSSLSLHEVGIADVAEIARELDMDLEVVTIGIEAGTVDRYSRDLDPASRGGRAGGTPLRAERIDAFNPIRRRSCNGARKPPEPLHPRHRN